MLYWCECDQNVFLDWRFAFAEWKRHQKHGFFNMYACDVIDEPDG